MRSHSPDAMFPPKSSAPNLASSNFGSADDIYNQQNINANANYDPFQNTSNMSMNMSMGDPNNMGGAFNMNMNNPAGGDMNNSGQQQLVTHLNSSNPSLNFQSNIISGKVVAGGSSSSSSSTAAPFQSPKKVVADPKKNIFAEFMTPEKDDTVNISLSHIFYTLMCNYFRHKYHYQIVPHIFQEYQNHISTPIVISTLV